MKIDATKLRTTPTQELKWLIQVGRDGLKKWKGQPRIDEVKKALAVLQAELKRRGK